MDAIVQLPDYLQHECLQDSGEIQSQEMADYYPAILYSEQMLRLWPRELSAKLRLTPAFEETFMKI